MIAQRYTIHCLRTVSRQSLQKYKIIGTPGVTRSSKITEIQRRLTEFELSSSTTSDTGAHELTSGTLIGDRILARNSSVDSQNALCKSAYDEKTEYRAVFPLSNSASVHSEALQASSTVNSIDERTQSGAPACDRGFYVEGGIYVDEYKAGTTSDFPEDEFVMPSRLILGPNDAVEHIDFQMPGQSQVTEDCSSSLVPSCQIWDESEDSVDISRPVSKYKCSGCGASFHCKNVSLPGFLPLEIFDKIEKMGKNGHQTLCRRCYMLKHYNFLLNVNVCSSDYITMMSHLQSQTEALILLVVDITDLPASIHRQLPQIIGQHKPMVVIGNKVDLLPPDARVGYLKRFYEILRETISEAGFLKSFNILHTALISAKTGYGVEDLITQIHLKWTNVKLGLRSDMYLVGCTNAGKSTLFNAFLQSDLCKVRAMDLVERATTSPWPGTTISLLKFPVMKPSPYRLEMRRRRLQRQQAWLQKENFAKRSFFNEGNFTYNIPTGIIQNTFKDDEDALQPVAIKDVVDGGSSIHAAKKNRSRIWTDDNPIFAGGTWCFDTPGTVNEDQVLGLFTLDELIKVVPRQVLRPRSCFVKVGQSLLIGGVARMDVESTDRESGIYVTVFVSDDLPLNIVSSKFADDFLSRHISTGALGVPSKEPERLREWPGLASKEFFISGYKGSVEKGSSDLVFSSIGWVMITTRDRSVQISAWSPAAKGLSVRQPMLPFSCSLRGKRIPGTQFYRIEPLEFPSFVKRSKRSQRFQTNLKWL